jgi:hypothetical protein
MQTCLYGFEAEHTAHALPQINQIMGWNFPTYMSKFMQNLIAETIHRAFESARMGTFRTTAISTATSIGVI